MSDDPMAGGSRLQQWWSAWETIVALGILALIMGAFLLAT